MKMQTEMFEYKINRLPEYMKKEVMDFIDFLLTKYESVHRTNQFRFDWEGALSDLKGKCTSVELQHKAPDWR
jgi:hypothetical protein